MIKIQIFVKIIFILMFFYFPVCGRQHDLPVVDTSVLRKWQFLVEGSGLISNNGVYIGYGISHFVFDISSSEEFVFKRLDGSWETQLDSVAPGGASITADNRLGIVGLQNNRVCIQELGKDKKVILSGVNFHRLVNAGGKQYLLYLRADNEGEFVIYDLSKNAPLHRFSHIIRTIVPESGGDVYLVSKDNGEFKLNLLNVTNGSTFTVWNGKESPSSIVTDKQGEQVSFKCGGSLWYFNRNKGVRASELLPVMAGDCKGLFIDCAEKFSDSGKLLFVRMQGAKLPPLNPGVNPVQVFSYQDAAFNIAAGRKQGNYLGIYNTNDGKLFRLEQEHERYRSIGNGEDVALISHCEGEALEYYWNEKGVRQDYLISLPDGKRTAIGYGNATLSPSGKYVIYQKDFGGDLYCMAVSTGKHLNLTGALPIPSTDDVLETPLTSRSRGLALYGWSEGEDYIVVYDRYDIWQLDINGIKAPVNLTKRYGRDHHIVFRFCQALTVDGIKLKSGEEFLLSTFNEETKDNGYYKLKLNSGKSPTLLTMGRYVYLNPGQAVAGEWPQKSRDKEIYLVWRMSTGESANYFWTKDFRKFTVLSDIHPERGYQWHTSSLINFTTKDGVKTQAVLYKPGNFDSTRKYPVLFNYYEHESWRLNAYLSPGLTDNYQYNYPMMLARGYLICLTDIHYKIGETAHSVVDAVEGAADYLSGLPYVDSSRYGICGGSMGGYETNCLATFSHKFAAAVAISGPSDLVSFYGNVPGLRDEIVENRQLRMGVSLSTNPVRYLRNSPVAYTKAITTPILIVNTTGDANVNVQQGIEYFISLRREGKRAWMLRYQHADHGIFDISDQRDLYTRMNQFYDHYLKDVSAPVWMTRGISVNETGVDAGFTHDSISPAPSRLLLK